MRLLQLLIRLSLFCFIFALAGGCGAADDEGGGRPQNERPPGDDEGQDDEGPDDEGEGGSGAPWHCAPKNWTAVLEEEGVYSVATEHYTLHLEVGSPERAEEMGRLAEAAWLAFSDYFDASPELGDAEQLTVKFFADKTRFQAALAEIDVESSSGGFYAFQTKTAYLHEQPNPYYSNTLFLHEMSHQFHHLSRTGNQNRPFWYTEGLAEYLSRHDWDGECVRLGAIPMLSWEDMPSKAWEIVKEAGLDVESILSEAREPSRAESWAIVAYLERAEGGALAEAFAAFRDRMDAGSPAGVEAFEELIGPLADFDADLAAWLPTAQEPLTPIYTEWMHIAPREIRAVRVGALSLARVKEAHEAFETTVENLSKNAYVGVLAGLDDDKNFVVYFVGDDHQLYEFKSVDGEASFVPLGSSATPDADGRFVWVVTHSAEGTEVEVNGTSLPVAGGFAPASGPAAYAADAIFTDMRW